MEFFRIQDKIVSWEMIEKTVRKALLLRTRGLSQQEVAERLLIDRTFISRLESLGELRKGKAIGCIGFPILNKEEILGILEKEGLDYIFLMTEKERLQYINNLSGKELLNEIMEIISKLRNCEVIICLGSDERLKLIEGILGGQIISYELGISPLTEDKWVDPKIIYRVLNAIKASRPR